MFDTFGFHEAILMKQCIWGQKKLQQEKKPAVEKKKAKKKLDHGKERKDKLNYIMKKHKRKATSGGIIVACAIHDNNSGKQVAQLSSNVQQECAGIVGQMVSDLNEGKKTLDTVIGELNALKGSS